MVSVHPDRLVSFSASNFGTGSRRLMKHKRSVILKLAVGGPLHADQLRRKHGKPGIAGHDHGFGIGHRVVGRRDSPGERRALVGRWPLALWVPEFAPSQNASR